METATIFYNEGKRLSDKPCFDARFDTQKLPGGAVVIGFAMQTSPGFVSQLMHPGDYSPAQREQLSRIMEYVYAVLQNQDNWPGLEAASSAL